MPANIIAVPCWKCRNWPIFFQESGEPLRLRYVRHYYGSYAENLNKVLEIMEGHFIRGFGDSQRPDAEIDLLPGAIEAADSFLAGHADSKARLERVAALIDGFETPYSMELLASIHWLAIHEPTKAKDKTQAAALLREWSSRKRKLFQAHHVEVAWQRLVEEKWI